MTSASRWATARTVCGSPDIPKFTLYVITVTCGTSAAIGAGLAKCAAQPTDIIMINIPANRSITLPPHLVERLRRRCGEIADLRPAGGDAGDFAHPAGAFGAASEVPFLEKCDDVVERRAELRFGPQTVDAALDG